MLAINKFKTAISIARKSLFSTVYGCFLFAATHTYATEIDWGNIGQPSATVLNSGTTVAATNNNCVPGVTFCDTSATVTFEVDNDGQGGEINCGFLGGAECGAYFDTEFGGINDDHLRFAIDATGIDLDDSLNICVEFDRLVEGLNFDVLDIDEGPFDDVIEVFFTDTPSATPILQRNDLTNAFAFGDISTGTDPNHVAIHDPSFAAPDNEVLGWGSIQPGGGNAGAGDDGGNVTLDFGSTRVWGFCIRYRTGQTSPADPAFQFLGLSGLTWTASLPVNLDYFSSSQVGNAVSVKWSTSAESFNIGFNLWGEVNGEWIALNRRMIPSQKVDSHSLLNYRRRIKLNRSNRAITQIGISSIDTLGNEEFYGPFNIGQSYGEQSVPEPIDWAQVVAKKDAILRDKGLVKRNGRWIHQSRLQRITNPEQHRLDVSFNKTGIVRLTHQDLFNAGLDLRGKKSHEIAVSHQGRAVPRSVRMNNRNRTFGERSFIDFYVDRLVGDLTLYNANNVYQVSTNPNLVANMRTVRANGKRPITPLLRKKIHFEQDRYYMNASTTGSPWLDQRIGLGGNPTLNLNLPQLNDRVQGTDLELRLQLMGGFDFPDIEEDHHLTVSINGHQLLNERWGGIDARVFSFQIPHEFLIAEGENTVTLTALNNEANIALLLFDNYQVSYQAKAQADAKQQTFTIEPNDGSVFEISLENRSRIWAYAQDDSGNIVRLATRRHAQKTALGTREYTLRLPKLNDKNTHYWLVKSDGFIKPVSMLLVPTTFAEVNQANLYIIADEAFISPELTGYVEFKRALGVTTELVSYQSIVEQFGYGFNDPLVIKEFLSEQQAGLNNSSVLLVGGHTFDYLDRTEQGSVSFIPTAYRPSSIIQYSPTDSPLVDLDQDGLVDVAIGRWPVRTPEQLSVIINKSMAWANGEGLANDSSVLLIAENDDANSGASFSQQLEGLVSRYDVDAPTYSNYWSQATRLYANNYAGTANPIAAQQADIHTELRNGHALTIYSGHGSPTSWSFRRLLDVNALTQLDDTHQAGMVIPLACYTTYYETISNESLANKLLFKEQGGAVLIAGAATLGNYASNGKILNQLMRYQAREQVTLGHALKLAKRSVGSTNIEQSNLWTILGDPTLRFNRDYQNQVHQEDTSDAESNPKLRMLN